MHHHQDCPAEDDVDLEVIWRAHFDEGVAWLLSYNELIWYPLLETIAGREVIDVCREELEILLRCARDVQDLLPRLHDPAIGADAARQTFQRWCRGFDQFAKLEEFTLMPVVASLDTPQIMEIEECFGTNSDSVIQHWERRFEI